MYQLVKTKLALVILHSILLGMHLVFGADGFRDDNMVMILSNIGFVIFNAYIIGIKLEKIKEELDKSKSFGR